MRHARLCAAAALGVALTLTAQTPPQQTHSTPGAEVAQLAQILGLQSTLDRLRALRAAETCGDAPTLEEVGVRQRLLESVVTAGLDVDSAMAEIASEQGDLGNLKTALTVRRDRTVARLNAAALLTGSGAGAAVSATQFSTLGTRANDAGDGVGIGSGAASTLLAYLALRKQQGPSGTVTDTPNMLAPLFDRPAVLNARYPAAVLAYLNSVPGGESAGRGTRLAQLKAAWMTAGRLQEAGAPRREDKLTVLTSSDDKDVTISIHDLTDRIAMLGDVSGKISLMKRDLADLMRTALQPQGCVSR